MGSAKGYYSLIQYCPDRSRLEAANIGVLLFCPERGYIRARTAEGNDRIRRFFRDKAGDLEQINAVKRAVENRLEVEASEFRTLQDLEEYIAKQANEIVITAPRPMKVLDPERDLSDLFEQLVGGRAAKKPASTGLKREMEKSFSQHNLDPYLRRDIQVMVKPFHRQMTVPFGFKNGRFNLIQPASFLGVRPDAMVARACTCAVEGDSLYKTDVPELGKVQLFVVGKFEETQADSVSVVEDILGGYHVRLFKVNEMDRLIDEIRRTGKKLS